MGDLGDTGDQKEDNDDGQGWIETSLENVVVGHHT